MADSDDEPPVQKRPQPRPRRRLATSRSDPLTSGSLGSTSTDSGNNSNQSSLSSPDLRVEDDFFSKSRTYRPVVMREVSKVDLEEESMLDQQEPALDANPLSNEILLDSDDEACMQPKEEIKTKQATELKRKREVSLTPPPEIVPRSNPVFNQPRPEPQIPAYTATVISDDEEEEELDPELAYIAANIMASQKLSQQQQLSQSTSSQPSSTTIAETAITVESHSPRPLQSPTLSSMPSQSSNAGSADVVAITASLESTTSSITGTLATPASTTVTGGAIPDTPVPEVQIMLRKIRHPLLVVPPELEQLMRVVEAPVKYIIKQTQSFRTIMELYCTQKQIRFSDYVFAFRGNRVMPSSTPQNLDFPRIAIIDVYETAAFKYAKELEVVQQTQKLAAMELEYQQQLLAREKQRIEQERLQNEREQQQLQQQQQQQQTHEETRTGDMLSSSQTGVEDEDKLDEDEDEVQIEYLFIKLRGRNTDDVKLKVKKSTKVETVLTHYKKLRKLDPNTPARLSWDDEDLDPSSTIGDTDIEDDDMLIVHIGNH